MSREYNPIYKILVKGDDDLVGLCAYAIYKKEKIKTIEKYKKSHQNQNPSDDFLEEWHKESITKIDKYKKKGDANLKYMMQIVMGTYVQDNNPYCTSKNISTKNTKEDESNNKPVKPNSFFSNVLANIVGAFIWALIPYILIILLSIITPQGTKNFIKKILPQSLEINDDKNGTNNPHKANKTYNANEKFENYDQ